MLGDPACCFSGGLKLSLLPGSGSGLSWGCCWGAEVSQQELGVLLGVLRVPVSQQRISCSALWRARLPQMRRRRRSARVTTTLPSCTTSGTSWPSCLAVPLGKFSSLINAFLGPLQRSFHHLLAAVRSLLPIPCGSWGAACWTFPLTLMGTREDTHLYLCCQEFHRKTAFFTSTDLCCGLSLTVFC